MPKKYLQVGGVATYIQHTGPSTLPNQPPALEAGEAIVCLHGAGSHSQFFAGVMEALEGRCSMLAFDQPGHGRSGQLDSLGAIDRMAEFTGALCDGLGLNKPVLFGHDMGGAVALELALKRPDRVRALVIGAAGERIDVSDTTLEQARRVSEGKERRPFDPSNFSAKTPPEVMKQAFMWGLRTDPRATYGDLLACQAWDAEDRLAQLTLPTLVVCGEDEHPVVQERASALAKKLPSSELQTIPGAGHALLSEAPLALAEELERFLGGLPA
ncbi:MAG: alpha/beta hydrolase [Myxococcota bacterium]